MSKNVIIAIVVLIVLVALVLIFAPAPEEPVVPDEPIVPDEPVEPEGSEALINIYFVDQELMAAGEVGYGEMIMSVEREVSADVWEPEAALTLLLDGLVGEESEVFTSSIPEGTELISLEVEDGIAHADFSAELGTAAGSATVITVQEQIYQTLTQFDEIEDVVITIEGEPAEEQLQP